MLLSIGRQPGGARHRPVDRVNRSRHLGTWKGDDGRTTRDGDGATRANRGELEASYRCVVWGGLRRTILGFGCLVSA